jgi:serine protease Do
MRRALLAGSLILALTSCGFVDDPSVPEGTAPPGVSLPPAPPVPVPPQSTAPSTSSRSAPPPTLQSAFETVQSGVTRFEVATCQADVTGSGFQLSPTLVATVAHVVHEGQVIRVVQGTMSTAGTVIGIDQGTDVALVRTAAPLNGYAFSFSDTDPRVGDQVAALGFPRGDPLAFSPGTVNGLDRKKEIGSFTRHGLLELDAATNRGSSGGPVIRSDGSVVGLVDAHYENKKSGATDQGRRWAVSSATARPLIAEWSARPLTVPLPDCRSATDADGAPIPEHASPQRDDVHAQRTLGLYFDAINDGDFATALAQLTAPGSLEDFQADVTSSVDTDIVYRTFHAVGEERVVWVTFTSRQDAGKGPSGRAQETCTNWSLDYVLTRLNGLWLIDDSRPHDGTGHMPCVTTSTSTPSPGGAPAQPSSSTAPPD